MAVPVSTGAPRIAISPWGEVEVDDRRVGTSPRLTELSLPAGRHQIVLRNTDLPPHSTIVNVTADQPITFKHQFLTTKPLHLAATFALSAALTGCVLPPPAPPSLMNMAERPAEKALLGGMRACDDALYPQAEQLLNQALEAGLASPRDRAVAHKHLAFIYCTSARLPACEAEFRSAKADEPAFALSNSEAGHPQWRPVWQRVKE